MAKRKVGVRQQTSHGENDPVLGGLETAIKLINEVLAVEESQRDCLPEEEENGDQDHHARSTETVDESH